ncbi:MAG: DUF6719 family protein [Alphaproteobacteria bacterium]
MKAVRVLVAFGAALVLASCETTYLKKEPLPGELRPGEVVYVDDGYCPEGQVKKVTGGNFAQNIPVMRECVVITRGNPIPPRRMRSYL